MAEPSNSTTPTPPRLTGNPKNDNQAIVDWAFELYKNIVIETRIVQKLNAIQSVDLLTQVIDNPPTQLQVNTMQNKINELLNAVKNS